MAVSRWIPLSLIVYALLSSLGMADDTHPLFKTHASFLELKADTEKACYFISNDCELCSASNGILVCSSVGIACEPTEWRCYEKPTPR
jgi:hypothetical protein